MKNKARILGIVAFVAVVIMMVVNATTSLIGSYALFSGQGGSLNNTLTFGKVNVDVLEDFDQYADPRDGEPIGKNPMVKNSDDSVDVWVRVAVAGGMDNFKFSATGDAADYHFWNEYTGLLPDGWVIGADGYFYYESTLKPGESTPPLFKYIKFVGDPDGITDASELDIAIYAEAVQSKAGNSSNAADAFAAIRDIT